MARVTQAARAQEEGAAAKGGGWSGFLLILALAMLASLAFRSFGFALFSIPTESMLPRLMVGETLAASKWDYGYSRHSLPLDLPLISGRIFARAPARGDVAIFKHPVDGTDYVKRVIGLPGEEISVRGGQVFVDGTPIARERAPDIRLAISPNTACAWGGATQASVERPDRRECRYAAWRETLPEGRSYTTLDLGTTPQDDWGPQIVPAGTVFMMGDNRDNSMDSRFPAVAGGGVGFVPQALLVGKARRMIWSTDGSARWLLPWTWFSAARWPRMGEAL